MSYCRQCGAYIPDGETRCFACGFDENSSGTATAREEEQSQKTEENRKNTTYTYTNTAETQEDDTGDSDDSEYHYSYHYNYDSPRRGADRYYSADEGQDRRSQYEESYRRDAKENRLMAYLAYLGPLVCIPLLSKNKSDFLHYHCNQGLVLLLYLVAVTFCDILPIVGGVVSGLGTVAGFIWMIMGLENVAKGRRRPLPVIGNINILK